jgi:formamidopyrimidine-DNA glycosylase
MPELPEVETVRRTLGVLVAGRTIEQVTVRLPRIIQRIEPEAFCLELAGQTIREVSRRGKFLRFVLDDWTLVSHLRMEGRYGVHDADEPLEPHTHVIFRFADGKELRYRDVRQFGTMELFRRGEEWSKPPLAKLGLEPLDPAFTAKALKAALAKRTAKIKPLLLDQTKVAGIGNIYADEALFRARIHPERTADSLTGPEWKRLHAAIVETLTEAVASGGSSVKSYVNGQGEMGMFQLQLNAYGRKNEPCPRCGRPIAKTVVGGRGTHFCPRCQKVPKPKPGV